MLLHCLMMFDMSCEDNMLATLAQKALIRLTLLRAKHCLSCWGMHKVAGVHIDRAAEV